ncbi:MAG: S9 family peptidase [Mycobacteriaceae bacterium]|nr:S9 family peptidase [Mycobacteriaceae bacterium]
MAPMTFLAADPDPGPGTDPGTDPFLWLEEVTGEAALNWVRRHNEPTLAELCGERFEQFRAQALEVLDTEARIPYVVRRGEHLYNFWRDAGHPRGVWRRTTLEQYRGESPDWDILIDVDELAADEDENWVWSGSNVIEPYFTRALISLSRGGADATVEREFDMFAREFVVDGFALPEAKTQIDWEDPDTVLVGTDFGEGSLTDSGYPRLVKRWRRGQPLSDAELLFSGTHVDVSVAASVDRTPGFERTLVRRSIDFFNSEVYELRDGEFIRIDAPTDATVSAHRGFLLIELRSDWYTGDAQYRAGSLLVADYDEFLFGTAHLRVIVEPDEHTCLHHYAWTRDRLVVVTLADVASRVAVFDTADWRSEPVTGLPEATNTVIVAADHTGDEVFLDSSGFDRPSRLLRCTTDQLEAIKVAPAFFDSENLAVTQFFATSADGTKIPYFVVRNRAADGPAPTLLGGYGGFEVARTPGYDGVMGRLWLARGGTYALANIRGGGEYGPTWHTQAMRAGRHKVAEDFAAVAHDLVSRDVTTVETLGAAGGSNGGLLMGIMLTQYPQLFGALVCSVPLLDMRRFHLLLAGASWVAEYGNPDDPADWEFIGKYSPYHRVSADRHYPPLLITTSTRDDRVHPAHARKMTAALEAAGHHVRYYENIEGGHAGAADNKQAAFKAALMFEFLWRTVGSARPATPPASTP